MSSAQGVSLEPYLRARAVNPTLIPSQPARTVNQRPAQQRPEDDFLTFLRSLAVLATTPITVPFRWIRQTLTSPLTISLALKLILLSVLTLGSAAFSVLAVGAFWYSWGTGGAIEAEGWLVYGSKVHRTPHAIIPLVPASFQEDLRYDIMVEMELVRPTRNVAEEMGNFMLSVELRSARDPETALLTASQPSLPPPPLPLPVFSLPTLPLQFLPPCLLPWPFRGLCPSRLLGYHTQSPRKSKRRSSPARRTDVVLLQKELMEGVLMNPGRVETAIGSAFVSIGREDAFNDPPETAGQRQLKEVRTTGWVVLRFTPRPTGIRWILSSHPLPPLVLLPPISLALTLTSSLSAFVLISYFIRPRRSSARRKSKPASNIKGMSEADLLEEKRRKVFDERDREERREEERRKREWEEVESGITGMGKMPEGRKRESTIIGGSETTAPSRITSSFAPVRETDTESVSTVTEQATASHAPSEADDHPDDASEWTEAGQ